MERIRIYFALMACAAALAGCSRTEPNDPEAQFGDPVAIELIATGEPVQITRATDTDLIKNAVILVWNENGTTLLHNRYLDYANNERIYLRVGTYKIFAVANLTDANCPNGNAKTYLSGVSVPTDLDGMYLLAGSSTPDNVIMCSGVVTKVLADNTTPVTIKLPRVQTRIALNIYNKTDGAGNVVSGVMLHSFFTNNLPQGSWLNERTTSQASYDYQAAGYGKTSPVKFSTLTATEEGSYIKYSVDIFTFENRRGTVSGVTANMYNRKEKAPDNALEINILGTTSTAVLNTYVLPGKGREQEAPPDTWYGNFDIDRNCIYHVNVYINSTTNIQSDSRRVHLETVVCGDLTSPEEGGGTQF